MIQKIGYPLPSAVWSKKEHRQPDSILQNDNDHIIVSITKTTLTIYNAILLVHSFIKFFGQKFYLYLEGFCL